MSHLLMPEETGTCQTCGTIIASGKKYCSRVCYYNRNNNHEDASTPVEEFEPVKFTPVEGSDSYDPIEEQLVEEGIIISDENEEFCEECGAPKYLGRCSRFTQHKAPKKPKSR